MTTIELLYKAIAKKGHTRNSFARAIGVDPKEIKRVIEAGKKNMTRERQAILHGYLQKAKTMPDAESRELTEEHRAQLKTAIIDKSGSVDEFCKAVMMNRNNVYQVLTGQRASIDGPVAKKLFKLLNIKP